MLLGLLLAGDAILSALTTITKSPMSMCGAKVGLFLPRSVDAMTEASRPRVLPSASTMNQSRVVSTLLRRLGSSFHSYLAPLCPARGRVDSAQLVRSARSFPYPTRQSINPCGGAVPAA